MKKEFLWGVCAILSVAYAIDLKLLNTGTNFYLVWLVLGILFLLIMAGTHCGLWRKLPTAVRSIFMTILIMGLTVFLITEGFIVSRFGAKGKVDLDYVIVLGAQVYENGPSPVLKYRLDKAVAYLNENPNTICIVSGGQGVNEPFSEAEGMLDYLQKAAISRNRIYLENQSKNTIANIKNSMEYLDTENDRV